MPIPSLSSFRRIALLILWILLPGTVLQTRAQVNIEKLRSFDLDGFAVSLNANLSLLSGNVEALDAGAGSRFDYRKGKHYVFLIGSVRYGELSHTPFTERWFGHIRYNYRLKNWLVGELFGQAERDQFTLLQVRLLAGAGLRFRHFHSEQVGLFQGTSYMIEFEDLDADNAADHPATVNVSRWSNYLNLRLKLNDQTYLINTIYLQPRLDAFGDIRVLDEAALAFALSNHLTFNAGVNIRYDSRPPGDIKTTDLSLRNGLTIQF
ncbi:MAG: DUF481 domain-containing protein [Rhodothermales bacterium]